MDRDSLVRAGRFAVALVCLAAGCLAGPTTLAKDPNHPPVRNWNGHRWHNHPDLRQPCEVCPGHSMVPLGLDRTPEYYFPRFRSIPNNTLFFPTYYNVYQSRGQNYLPFVGDGGCHPAGHGLPSTYLPSQPYQDAVNAAPVVNVPAFSGRVEARPESPGATDLIP